MSRQQDTSTQKLGLSNADFHSRTIYVISSHFSGGHCKQKEPLQMLCEYGQVLPFLKRKTSYIPLSGSMNPHLTS